MDTAFAKKIDVSETLAGGGHRIYGHAEELLLSCCNDDSKTPLLCLLDKVFTTWLRKAEAKCLILCNANCLPPELSESHLSFSLGLCTTFLLGSTLAPQQGKVAQKWHQPRSKCKLKSGSQKPVDVVTLVGLRAINVPLRSSAVSRCERSHFMS